MGTLPEEPGGGCKPLPGLIDPYSKTSLCLSTTLISKSR